MRHKKGFTLIELLVVIAIIGLLSTLAVVSLNSARQKSRDAKRVSDIKQVQTALEMYFTDQNKYPVQATAALVLGGATSSCLGTAGFSAACAGDVNVYMPVVPADPGPGTNTYSYGITDGTSYTISFTLESGVAGLTGRTCSADPDKISCT
jgi:type II secretion system protein G